MKFLFDGEEIAEIIAQHLERKGLVKPSTGFAFEFEAPQKGKIELKLECDTRIANQKQEVKAA